MKREAKRANPAPVPSTPALPAASASVAAGEAPLCELVVRNGRHAGARVPLTGPVTLVGRGAGCDIRLQMEGVDGRHCLLAHTAMGLVLRDLQSQRGTLVNGERAQIVGLANEDVITVGPVEFLVQGLAEPGKEPAPKEDTAARDAWRVQTAAVAAQQAALELQEAHLEQQRRAFEQQQEQLATHLEEKRRKLLALTEEARAEREALDRDRAAYESQVNKIKDDLTEGQRELMEGQRKIQKERERLSDMNQRLKARWHRFWLAERKKLRASQAELAEQAQLLGERINDLRAEEERLEARRLRFNTLYEFGRGQLRDAWARVRKEQFQWKHRRGKERAALKVRERDLETAERQLVKAQHFFLLDKKAWDARKLVLETEHTGLEKRVENHRLRILDLRKLNEGLSGPQAAPDANNPTAFIGAVQTESPVQENPIAPAASDLIKAQEFAAPTRPEAAPADAENIQQLQVLASSLSDQRLELVEQWQRLTLLYRAWQREKDQASLELENLARKLLDQGQALARKESDQHSVEENLKTQQEELGKLRHQMIAWRTRLRTREQTWEGERARLLTETRHRVSLADQEHTALVEMRQRWTKRQQEEKGRIQADQLELEQRRQQVQQARQELTLRTAALEDEKRILTEKALALEQFRQEITQKTNQPNADRKLERFRRRWVTQNTLALRHLASERESLQKELADLDNRAVELHRRGEAVQAAETELLRKQAAWEYHQNLTEARQNRMREELRHAEQQRALFEQQYQQMREEVERIARSLYAEPEPPTRKELAA